MLSVKKIFKREKKSRKIEIFKIFMFPQKKKEEEN